MGEEYIKQYEIGYYDTDQDGRLTMYGLVTLFQELAISHSASLGFTTEYLMEKKRGWIITNWHIIMDGYPAYGEIVNASTWSNKIRHMQAVRNFTLTGQEGQQYCRAMSRWIYMDLEKRKPSDIDTLMLQQYYCEKASPIEGEKFLMPKTAEGARLLSTRKFQVARHDTDTNGHTNNTRYIAWALDDIPDEIYQSYRVKDMKVVYRKECYKDSWVTAQCYQKEDEKEVSFISFLTDEEGQVLAHVITLWDKKA